jgi:hypothetical protein
VLHGAISPRNVLTVIRVRSRANPCRKTTVTLLLSKLKQASTLHRQNCKLSSLLQITVYLLPLNCCEMAERKHVVKVNAVCPDRTEIMIYRLLKVLQAVSQMISSWNAGSDTHATSGWHRYSSATDGNEAGRSITNFATFLMCNNGGLYRQGCLLLCCQNLLPLSLFFLYSFPVFDVKKVIG